MSAGASGPGGLRGMRRRAVADGKLVEVGALPGANGLPALVTPALENASAQFEFTENVGDIGMTRMRLACVKT